METKINVAKILKNKPEGTKLWTDMFGEVTLYVVTDKCDAFQVKHHNKEPWFDENGKMYEEGVLCIYPSKSMRDWEKFTWKKDDVLVNSSGFKLFFDRWANDDYTRFFGKVNLLENSFSYETEKYTLASKDENLDTLEIEKPEFKDGDIVVYKCEIDDVPSNIFIFRGISQRTPYYSYYASLDSDGFLSYKLGGFGIYKRELRLATEEEKEQLFSALEKKGKAWDAKKKMIVDKYEFKPMDLCLMKYIGQYNNRGWELCQYAYTEHRVSSSGEQRDFYHAVGGEIYAECIPYKGNEHLLGTKKSK